MNSSRIALFACILLTLMVIPMAPASAQQASQHAQETRLFQIVVLVGDMEKGGIDSAVPANTRQAVEDVAQFLPYTSYRLVDTALMRSAKEGQAMMSGPQNQDYVVALSHYKGEKDGKIFLREFQLMDRSNDSRMLIRTSFEVGLRETIVVGSSKLDGGGQALVVLFTAVQ